MSCKSERYSLVAQKDWSDTYICCHLAERVFPLRLEFLSVLRRPRSQEYSVASPWTLTPQGSWAWISPLWQPDTKSVKARAQSPRQAHKRAVWWKALSPSRRGPQSCGGVSSKGRGRVRRKPCPWSSFPFISTVSSQPALKVPCSPVFL